MRLPILRLFIPLVSGSFIFFSKQLIINKMEFDQNKIETQITEQIMLPLFSGFNPNKTVVELSGAPYNRIYEHIHKTLSSLGLNEKFKKDHDAVELYKYNLRHRYQSKVDAIRDQFPNGLFTKDSDGELVGISVMLSKLIKELLEAERLSLNER